MRRRFVLDKKTDKLLERLASHHAGNHSIVLREAILYYADMQKETNKIKRASKKKP